MAKKLADVITLGEVRNRNLWKMLNEHSSLDFNNLSDLDLSNKVQCFFNRFESQVEYFHSILDTEFDNLFDYLSPKIKDKVKDSVRKIYRQYECVIKGVGKNV